jgi:hypothetical protein
MARQPRALAAKQCEARSIPLLDRQPWSRRRGERSPGRASMKTISGRKSLQVIENHTSGDGTEDLWDLFFQ